ncbi:MAG: carboxylesterase [Hydrogenovibrio sp.]|uniref:alpha/beta hydrolase n=1 Tax=Hydrogenovibrio sp. TaxID=2065821 RepID=UPI00286FB3BA|nr:carboxylesterase [Hydrogenovibrio sp.]MDR9498024.1 carboxylesterase [Hydrogenovibrio sp.]
MHKTQTPTAVILEPSCEASACVIWLHGLGADGHDFEGLVPQLGLPVEHSVRFVFPHAPVQPVTINLGESMRAWYDIRSMDLQADVDWPGVDTSVARVQQLMSEQIQAGIPAERLLIAGFSQGGLVALEAAMSFESPLAGILALSTYWPPRPDLQTGVQPPTTPVMIAHGLYDPICPCTLSEQTRQRCLEAGFDPLYHTYPMQHEVCAEEVGDIRAFLKNTLLT